MTLGFCAYVSCFTRIVITRSSVVKQVFVHYQKSEFCALFFRDWPLRYTGVRGSIKYRLLGY